MADKKSDEKDETFVDPNSGAAHQPGGKWVQYEEGAGSVVNPPSPGAPEVKSVEPALEEPAEDEKDDKTPKKRSSSKSDSK